METTAIHIDTRLYNEVAEYAHKHNTSIDKMMENYLVTLIMPTAPKRIKRPTQFSEQLLKLVGIAKHAADASDLNDDEAKWEYLKRNT